jgi:hypothetical protein
VDEPRRVIQSAGADDDTTGGFEHGGWHPPYFDDLVDGYRLMIDPLVLGGGKGIFRDDGVLRALRLVDGQVTSTGAILSTYARA